MLAPEFDIRSALRAVLGTAPEPSGPRVTATLPVEQAEPGVRPLIVQRAGPRSSLGPVVVAVDADRHPGVLLRYGWTLSVRLGVPLRVVYVWTDCQSPDCPGHRVCHRDLWDAERLLNAVLDEHLPIEAMGHVEREVLHATEAGPALAAVSSAAALLVVGSSSDPPGAGAGGTLGTTTRALVGRTRCPLAVVPYDAAPGGLSGW
jgi:hypothetical protein